MSKIDSFRNKNIDQIKAIKETQYATEQAMAGVITYLQTTENPSSEEAHKIIDSILEKFDCESPEGHIVAGGIHSAEPHEHGKGQLAKGVPIVIDIFPKSKISGYYADMSRTVCIGAPSPELQRMYRAVLDAQLLAISMIKPGVKCREIQETVDGFFVDAGYITSGKGKEFKFEEGFVHSVGHGVGLNIHESPFINKNSNDVLEEGQVITIEPGLCYKTIGGVRLEDLILVTLNGYENLTNFPKRLII